jgi:hypothetical protein
MGYSRVLLVIAILVLSAPLLSALADPLIGANKQRIGNYDLEVMTEPRNVDAGKPVTLMLRISGVNGDDLVDVPIVIRIAEDGTEIFRTKPIVVPYGHHNFEFTFPEPGTYALYMDLTDYMYSGEILTFTFPITAAGPVDYISQMLPVGSVIAAATIGVAVVLRKRKVAVKR